MTDGASPILDHETAAHPSLVIWRLKEEGPEMADIEQTIILRNDLKKILAEGGGDMRAGRCVRPRH